MDGHTGRIVHSYDVATRRVLCGVAEPGRSTKHASGVTCVPCRELLRRAPRALAAVGVGGAGGAANGG